MTYYRPIFASLTLIAIAACGDDPTGPTREITLSFCSNLSWVAYQNEGGAWTRLANSAGTYTLRATERLAIVTVHAPGPNLATLELHFLTADQAVTTFRCGVTPPTATKILHGSVRGLGSNDQAYVMVGPSIAVVHAAIPTFTITGVRNGPVDVVATHMLPFSSQSVRVQRVIVRRAENRANNSTMPALNFDSTEAFEPQYNTLTLTGVPAGSTIGAQTDFLTPSETLNPLGWNGVQGSSVPIYSVPASRLVQGDLQQLNAGTSHRHMLLYYTVPVDRTVALGPEPSAPSFTTLESSPTLRLRVDVGAQPEYASQILFYLFQSSSLTDGRTIGLWATKEYFGDTPTTWSLTIPDLSGVEGFQSSWGLQPGSYTWNLLVHGRPFGFSPRSARDGDVFYSAFLFGPS
ncbi:MAG: hypothetical protein M3373_03905 [Gemmatimonadota bacterium]|nr:hypothetical protein [Gemmatimonadota bacterium]